jgi:hypothetical protein
VTVPVESPSKSFHFDAVQFGVPTVTSLADVPLFTATVIKKPVAGKLYLEGQIANGM